MQKSLISNEKVEMENIYFFLMRIQESPDFLYMVMGIFLAGNPEVVSKT